MAKGNVEGDIIYRDKASAALEKAGKSADTAGKKFGGMSKAAAAGGALAGAALFKFGKDSVEAAAEAQKSQAGLDLAFKKFPKLADTNVAALQNFNSELARKVTFDDDALASGQAVLAQFNLTGKQIQSITPLLADYATKTGQSLPDAAAILGKAMNGNAKALKAVGIQIPAAAGATKALEAAEKDAAKAEEALAAARKKGDPKAIADATQKLAFAQNRLKNAQEGAAFAGDSFGRVMDGLKAKVGGTAEAMGGTAAGKAEILKNQYGEIQETVGTKLIPVLSSLATVGLKVIDFISRNSDVIVPLLGVLATLVAGIKIWTAAQAALNVVMALNPIGLVVIAVAALAAGLVIAYKKSDTFRAVVHAAMNGARKAIGWVVDRGKDLVGFFTDLPGKLVSLGKSIVNALTAPYREAFHWIAVAWNATVGQLHFEVPSWVPEIGGKGFSVPKLPETIPALAAGGIVNRPTLALVGEAGPEAVVPLGRAGGLGTTINITINGAMDARATAREVQKMLLALKRERGENLGLA